MKNKILVLSSTLLLASGLFGQGVNGPRGTIWLNDGSTGTTVNLLAVSSAVDNTAVLAGPATTGIIGVCISNCGTTGSAVIANWGDVPCTFSGTATDGHHVQAAGSASNCVDAGASYPASGGEILGVVKQGGSGAGTYLVTWRANPNGTSGGGSGTVTSFSAGTLSPLFTTSVGTSTTTPALTFSLSTAGAHSFFGNNTG